MAKPKPTLTSRLADGWKLFSGGWKAGLQPFLEILLERLEERLGKPEGRIFFLQMVYLSFFAGVIFLALGIFYLLVDYCGIPRGVVFSVGGLLILLVSFVYLKAGQKD